MKSQEITVVGLKHRVTTSSMRQLQKLCDKAGILCSIEREPLNPADPNAIKVVIEEAGWKGMHVAYFPRKLAEVYAPALDAGVILEPRLWLLDIDIERGEAEALFEWKSPGRKRKSKK